MLKNIMSKLKKITNSNRKKIETKVDIKEQKLAVCAFIYDLDNRILSVSRKDNMVDFGLIGGKVDAGETLVDALVRETKEETGLSVVEHTLLWERQDSDYKVYTFLCLCEGTIKYSESGVVRWLIPDEYGLLLKGSFGDYNKQLLKYLVDNPLKYPYDYYASNKITG